ncbi:hypothetical protein [Thermotalea metallivorans]|uniref:Uncharacterized protein n=1 Tax=Thermotalea metallivorans TaxID=520762 RepID=A0A140L7Z2_9FIRM|nr:hypothetical protein [Thermotalea metallivorans]KXG76667.1 hypothetical protein AN619_08860 [Thermotalea metallivorans]
MKKDAKKAMVNIFILMMQWTIFFSIIGLEYLSHKRMGVMRYLLFKKYTYETLWLQPYFINVYVSVLFGGLVICLFWYIHRKDKGSARRHLLLAFIINLAGIFFILAPKGRNLNAYPFFLIGIFINLILQYTRLWFNRMGYK